MKYAEAFKSLGYELSSPRQQWTAESATGVCITLRRKLVQKRTGGLWYDSTLHGGDYSIWGPKAGNRIRAEHLKAAISHHDSWVDAVLVEGESDEEYGDAQPWRVDARKGHRWRVLSLDETSGHFSVETQKCAS